MAGGDALNEEMDEILFGFNDPKGPGTNSVSQNGATTTMAKGTKICEENELIILEREDESDEQPDNNLDLSSGSSITERDGNFYKEPDNDLDSNRGITISGDKAPVKKPYKTRVDDSKTMVEDGHGNFATESDCIILTTTIEPIASEDGGNRHEDADNNLIDNNDNASTRRCSNLVKGTDTTNSIENDEPTVIDDEPTVIDDEPTVIDDEPTVIDDEPTVIDDEPTVIDDEPTVIDDEPTVIDDEPTVIDDEPTVIDDEPTVIDDEPTVIDDEPTVIDDEPTVIDDEPTVIDESNRVVDGRTARETPGIDCRTPHREESVANGSSTRTEYRNSSTTSSEKPRSHRSSVNSISSQGLSSLDSDASSRSDKRKKVGHYLLEGTIGEGSYATVFVATHLPTRHKVAVKTVTKRSLVLKETVRHHFRREALLLQKLCHPNIVKLYEAMETSNAYYLVFEMAHGGHLLNYVSQRGNLTEDETRAFMKQLVSAIDHLHMSGIVHRDIKLENILLDNPNSKNVKLVDFGFSTVCHTNALTTQCGCPLYAAPEVFAGRKYGRPVDIWSLGVCFFAMLLGRLPFLPVSNSLSQLFSIIIRGCLIPTHLTQSTYHILREKMESDKWREQAAKSSKTLERLNKSRSATIATPISPQKAAVDDGSVSKTCSTNDTTKIDARDSRSSKVDPSAKRNKDKLVTSNAYKSCILVLKQSRLNLSEPTVSKESATAANQLYFDLIRRYPPYFTIDASNNLSSLPSHPSSSLPSILKPDTTSLKHFVRVNPNQTAALGVTGTSPLIHDKSGSLDFKTPVSPPKFSTSVSPNLRHFARKTLPPPPPPNSSLGARSVDFHSPDLRHYNSNNGNTITTNNGSNGEISASPGMWVQNRTKTISEFAARRDTVGAVGDPIRPSLSSLRESFAGEALRRSRLNLRLRPRPTVSLLRGKKMADPSAADIHIQGKTPQLLDDKERGPATNGRLTWHGKCNDLRRISDDYEDEDRDEDIMLQDMTDYLNSLSGANESNGTGIDGQDGREPVETPMERLPRTVTLAAFQSEQQRQQSLLNQQHNVRFPGAMVRAVSIHTDNHARQESPPLSYRQEAESRLSQSVDRDDFLTPVTRVTITTIEKNS